MQSIKSKTKVLPPKPKRLLAIGDIHGYLDKLDALLDTLQPTSNDKFIFIGDYIDRGPNSRGVIERLLAFHKQFPKTIFLRGNHEQMLLDWQNLGNADDREIFMRNGGQATMDSYGGSLKQIPVEHLDFINATQLLHLETIVVDDGLNNEDREQDFLFVHAGVNPERQLNEQSPHDLLWIREAFIRTTRPYGNSIVVHGHTPTDNVPGGTHYRISIDSGVHLKGPIKRNSRVLGGKLTCCNVLTRHIWQA
jgi:serine/threonine protein phosphatase 1